jgi:hypothetical protein
MPEHTPTGTSRRQFPRIPVQDRLSIAFADLKTPARLRDLSLGGFGLETPVPVSVGERRLFRIGTSGEPQLLATARATYCRQVPGEERHISGWAAESGDATRVLADAVASLTREPTFEG